ncbi:hypothetical protein M758_N014400 [Ceratodon purpureus]|nr:hypothetical protein M758_N014400 [Ceratodon purpureus]
MMLQLIIISILFDCRVVPFSYTCPIVLQKSLYKLFSKVILWRKNLASDTGLVCLLSSCKLLASCATSEFKLLASCATLEFP